MIADTVASSNPGAMLPSDRNLPTKESQLEMDDFLKLLTSQLQYQDPLEPMKDTEFIAQMASFSSLEQMNSMNKNFENFFQSQMNSSVQSYLGKVVTLGGNNDGQSGLVTAVSNKGGEMKLTLNGRDYNAADVTRVELPKVEE